MIGGLSRAATSILRQLIDAGTLSNLPAGFKSRGVRIVMMMNLFNLVSSETLTRLVGTFVLPFNLCRIKNHREHWHSFWVCWLIVVVAYAAIADNKIGDMNTQAPVGTTVALLERGSRS